MASIHKDIIIDAHPDDVWDALRDFGAVHTRLVPGFVLDTKLEGDARIVTFANGTVAREILVDCDDAKAAAGLCHRQRAAETAQRLGAGVRRWRRAQPRGVWIVDVLPHEIAPYMDAQMDQGALAMQKALGARAASLADVIFLTERSAAAAVASPRASGLAPLPRLLRTEE